jgi:hypothetical protein
LEKYIEEKNYPYFKGRKRKKKRKKKIILNIYIYKYINAHSLYRTYLNMYFLYVLKMLFKLQNKASTVNSKLTIIRFSQKLRNWDHF